MSKIEEIISEYRRKDLQGKIIDLSPMKDEDLVSIVCMRNDPKMMHYFNQSQKITLNEQKMWFSKYKKRTDDLYWSIKNKDGQVIGANRLYNITETRCDQGSLMIDTKYSMTAPFAVEGILLSLDFAFDVLGLKIIVNENRHDNKNMNSLSKRFGFQFLRKTDIRGVTYNYYELQPENYKRDEIREVLNLWLNR